MYRSLGRMFILCDKAELTTDLNADLARIAQEAEKNTNMKTMLDGKKDQLTKQLNDLSPAPQWLTKNNISPIALVAHVALKQISLTHNQTFPL